MRASGDNDITNEGIGLLKVGKRSQTREQTEQQQNN